MSAGRFAWALCLSLGLLSRLTAAEPPKAPVVLKDQVVAGSAKDSMEVRHLVLKGNNEAIGGALATLAKERYMRFQAALRYSSDALDDASEGNLRRLEGDAERLIAERTADIETLCEEIAG